MRGLFEQDKRFPSSQRSRCTRIYCKGMTYSKVIPALLVLMSSWLLASQDLTTQINLIPAYPNIGDAIIYELGGTWRDGCVPRSPSITIMGNVIWMRTSNPSQICLQMLTPWYLTGSIGKLKAGQYQLVVTYSGPTVPGPGMPLEVEIGRRTFAVSPLPQNERIFPIVVNGSAGQPPAHYQTAFTLVNAGSVEFRANLQVHDSTGKTRAAFCSVPPVYASNIDLTLPPGGRFHQSSSGDLPFLNGWARLRWEGSDSMLGAAEVTAVEAKPVPCLPICSRPSNEILSTTQTPAVRPAQEFRFPITFSTNSQTAVAVVNPSTAETIKVRFVILDSSGTEAKLLVASRFDLTVGPLQRISRFLWDLAVEYSPIITILPIPVPEMFHGSVFVTADGPVAAGAVNVIFPEGKFASVATHSPMP